MWRCSTNVDATWTTKEHKAGYGVVVYDSEGMVHAGYARQLEETFDALSTDALAIIGVMMG